MTNAQIIYNVSEELLKQGVLKTTGRKLTFVDAEGNEITADEPEAIHTFNGWKELGFKVRKGEKAIAKFPIWKCAASKKTDDEEAETVQANPHMFMKNAAWFSASQVEPMKG